MPPHEFIDRRFQSREQDYSFRCNYENYLKLVDLPANPQSALYNQMPKEFIKRFLTEDSNLVSDKIWEQATLRQAAAFRRAKPLSKAWEPLESQINRWWENLPKPMKHRSFQIAEVAASCHGRFRERPPLRDAAAALRALGWTTIRDWRKLGASRRHWCKTQVISEFNDYAKS